LIYLSGAWTKTFLTMGGELICYCTKITSNKNKNNNYCRRQSGVRVPDCHPPSLEEVIKYWEKEMWQFERKDKSLLPSLSSQKQWKTATFVAGALLLSRPYATVVEWWFTECEPSILQSNSARRKNSTWNCVTNERNCLQVSAVKYFSTACVNKSGMVSPVFWTKNFCHVWREKTNKMQQLDVYY